MIDFGLIVEKDLSRVKASFKSVPPQLSFEIRAIFWHWLAQQIQNKFGEERFKSVLLSC